MDAMGLSNKKPNTVSTSHSGSFTPNNPDLAKAAGIVSVPQLPLPPTPRPWALGSPCLPRPGLASSHCPVVRVPMLGTGLGVDTALHSQVPQSGYWDTVPHPLGLLLLALCLFGCDFLRPLCPSPNRTPAVICVLGTGLLCGHLLPSLGVLEAPLLCQASLCVRTWAAVWKMHFVSTYCGPSPEFL